MQRLNRAEYIDEDAVFSIRRKSLTLRDGVAEIVWQVVGPQQRRPDDRMCSRHSQVMSIGGAYGDEWRRRRLEHSSRPGISVLGSAEHRDCELVLHQCTK